LSSRAVVAAQMLVVAAAVQAVSVQEPAFL
jgi:hypothetical protein